MCQRPECTDHTPHEGGVSHFWWYVLTTILWPVFFTGTTIVLFGTKDPGQGKWTSFKWAVIGCLHYLLLFLAWLYWGPLDANFWVAIALFAVLYGAATRMLFSEFSESGTRASWGA